MRSLADEFPEDLAQILPEEGGGPPGLAADQALPEEVVKLIKVDQTQLARHVDGLVRSAVEDTLNALLDAEADQLCGAQRYERSPDRTDYRAGSYTRKLHTKAGEVERGKVLAVLGWEIVAGGGAGPGPVLPTRRPGALRVSAPL
jgi:hypothetical protein